MRKINRYALFFIISFVAGFSDIASGAENSTLDLERIIVVKNKGYPNAYALDSNTLKSLSVDSVAQTLSFYPLDLQSRYLKSGVQTDFSLRGSNFQGVLILLDGERLNDPQTGHHNSDLALTKEDIESIQVMPGVSSSLFGPDAIGGAINIILKKPEMKNIVFELEGGSYESKSGLFSITDKLNNLGFRLSLDRAESNGFRYDTDYKVFTANLTSSLELAEGDFNTTLGYNEKEFGAFDFYTPGSNYASKEWTKTYLLDTGLSLDKDGLIIKPNFLWRRHYDKFMLDKTQIRSSYLNHHRTDVLTPNIYFQRQLSGLGRFGLGTEYGQERINSTNLGKHLRPHKSIFMDNTSDLTSRISEGLSFRWDNFDSFGQVYTGALNLRYSLSENNLFNLGINRSMRIPSFTELYYNDPTTVGDSNLKAESALGYQFGYEYKKEDLKACTTIFLRQEQDMIDWVKHSPSDTKWKVENISTADVFGTETYLKLKINDRLKLDANYTYINKYIRTQDLIYKYGPNYIRHLFNAVFTLNLPFGDESLGFTYKQKPNRRGWFLLNAALSKDLNKNSRIFLKITNLLNVEYQEIEGIAQPGRWVEAGLRFDW